MFSISKTAIDIEKLSSALTNDSAGAYVSFEGRVRNHNDGRKVIALEYEAYEELALNEGQQVMSEAMEQFSIIACRAVHRTGSLKIGDAAVWVGVVSAHRGDAFEACRYIIDEIKDRLPVWKREHYESGEIAWVNCAAEHHQHPRPKAGHRHHE